MPRSDRFAIPLWLYPFFTASKKSPLIPLGTSGDRLLYVTDKSREPCQAAGSIQNSILLGISLLLGDHREAYDAGNNIESQRNVEHCLVTGRIDRNHRAVRKRGV